MMQGVSDQQYVAKFDEAMGTWRVLDTWDGSLRSVYTSEFDIPDDHEAVTLITEGKYIAIIKEATRLGMLENASITAPRQVDNSEKEDGLRETIRFLESEKADLKLDLEIAKNKTPKTESFEIKKNAMDSILRLAGMHDISSVE